MYPKLHPQMQFYVELTHNKSLKHLQYLLMNEMHMLYICQMLNIYRFL